MQAHQSGVEASPILSDFLENVVKGAFMSPQEQSTVDGKGRSNHIVEHAPLQRQRT